MIKDIWGSIEQQTGKLGYKGFTYTYTAFGAEKFPMNLNDIHGYAGYVRDRETDSYYANARQYLAQIHRFMSKDKFRVDSLNRYLYVVNNPVNLIDPSGLRIAIDVNGRVTYNQKNNLIIDEKNGTKLTKKNVDSYINNNYSLDKKTKSIISKGNAAKIYNEIMIEEKQILSIPKIKQPVPPVPAIPYYYQPFPYLSNLPCEEKGDGNLVKNSDIKAKENKTGFSSGGFAKHDDNYSLVYLGYDGKYGSTYTYLSTVEADGELGFGVQENGERMYGGNAYAEYSSVDVEVKSNDWNITDNIKTKGSLEGEILNAGVDIGAGYSSEKGIHASAGAMASGVAGTVESSTTIFGVKFSGSVTGRAGALGGEASASVAGSSELIHVKLGAAVLFGITIEFSIGWE